MSVYIFDFLLFAVIHSAWIQLQRVPPSISDSMIFSWLNFSVLLSLVLLVDIFSKSYCSQLRTSPIELFTPNSFQTLCSFRHANVSNRTDILLSPIQTGRADIQAAKLLYPLRQITSPCNYLDHSWELFPWSKAPPAQKSCGPHFRTNLVFGLFAGTEVMKHPKSD